MACYALLVASGVGKRLGHSTPKQYLEVQNKPLLGYALDALTKADFIASTLVLLAPGDRYAEKYPLAKDTSKDTVRLLYCGGASRAATVFNGLKKLEQLYSPHEEDWILVHDAARPALTPAMLLHLWHSLATHSVGGALAVPVSDSVKRTDSDNDIFASVVRDNLWLAQTPQMMRFGILKSALEKALETNFSGVTDELSAVAALGLQGRLVLGEKMNFKVTYPEDYEIMKLWLGSRDFEKISN